MKTLSILHQSISSKSVAKLLLLAGAACLMGHTLLATNLTWTGAASDNLYWTAGNWSTAGSPTSNDPTQQPTWINLNGATVNMEGGGYGAMQFHVSADTTVGAAPVLNMDLAGSELDTYNELCNVGGERNNGGGVVNLTGGIYTDQFWINTQIGGIAGDSFTNCSGTFNFGGTSTAPAIMPGQGSNNGNYFSGTLFGQLSAGFNATCSGVVNFSGYGTYSTAGQIVSGTVQYTWGTGGTMYIGFNGTGKMTVTGGNLSIVTGNLSLAQGSGTATLQDTIDSTGISTITVKSVTLGSNAYFNLTLGSGFTATNGQVFTIITSTGGFGSWAGTFANLADGGTITDDGYTFTASYGDTGMILTAAVPEPSTAIFVLSGLMGMGLTLRRRK